MLNPVFHSINGLGYMINIIITSIRQINKLQMDIYRCVSCGTINLTDASGQIEMLNKKELELKEQLVNKVHVKKGGKPRKIIYNELSGLWNTLMPDKKRICAKTLPRLYDKLLKEYGLSILETTIKGVFEASLNEKARTENNDEATITRYQYSYDRFITDEFGNLDITKVTKADLKEYTQTMVNSLHPKKKAFLSYKGVLNLIFGYAVEYDIISVNPVTAIRNSVYLKSCDNRIASSEDKILSEQEIEIVKAKVRKRMKE